MNNSEPTGREPALPAGGYQSTGFEPALPGTVIWSLSHGVLETYVPITGVPPSSKRSDLLLRVVIERRHGFRGLDRVGFYPVVTDPIKGVVHVQEAGGCDKVPCRTVLLEMFRRFRLLPGDLQLAVGSLTRLSDIPKFQRAYEKTLADTHDEEVISMYCYSLRRKGVPRRFGI